MGTPVHQLKSKRAALKKSSHNLKVVPPVITGHSSSWRFARESRLQTYIDRLPEDVAYFHLQLKTTRETYQQLLRELIDEKWSPIENGKFIDMGVCKNPAVKMGSPEERALPDIAYIGQPDKNGWVRTIDGLCLLALNIQKLPAMKNTDFIEGVLIATGKSLPVGDPVAARRLAATTMAEGLRGLFISQGGLCRVSSNWKVA